jgi:xanthine dehydrogenase YagS FAD-binding subunit
VDDAWMMPCLSLAEWAAIEEQARLAPVHITESCPSTSPSAWTYWIPAFMAETPERDNTLDRGDLIIAIEVPASPDGRASHYLKLRDRQSYEFALVSAAVALTVDGRRIRSARLALGGVAHKPWRLADAEAALGGVSLDEADALHAAISLSFVDARPLVHNGFKIELAQRVALRALQIAGERA